MSWPKKKVVETHATGPKKEQSGEKEQPHVSVDCTAFSCCNPVTLVFSDPIDFQIDLFKLVNDQIRATNRAKLMEAYGKRSEILKRPNSINKTNSLIYIEACISDLISKSM